jgi:hypothetical protein
VTIDGGPEKTSSSEYATFDFSADHRDATFECAMDNSGYSGCTSGVTYQDLAVGDHEFTVRARSNGRTGSPATWRWTVTA